MALAPAEVSSRIVITHCHAVCAFVVAQAADTGLSPVGEVLLVPDLLAAVPLPWCPGHSMAPVDMMERDLSELYSLRLLARGTGSESHEAILQLCRWCPRSCSSLKAE